MGGAANSIFKELVSGIGVRDLQGLASCIRYFHIVKISCLKVGFSQCVCGLTEIWEDAYNNKHLLLLPVLSCYEFHRIHVDAYC